MCTLFFCSVVLHACLRWIERYVGANDSVVKVFLILCRSIWQYYALSAVSHIESDDVSRYIISVNNIRSALKYSFLFVRRHSSGTKGHSKRVALVCAIHDADHFHEIISCHVIIVICLKAAIALLILIVWSCVDNQLRLNLDWNQAWSLGRIVLGNICLDVVSLWTDTFLLFCAGLRNLHMLHWIFYVVVNELRN